MEENCISGIQGQILKNRVPETCSQVHDSQVTDCQETKLISRLGLQVNVGQRHLGDLVEAQRERDGAQDEERVIDGHPHEHDDAGVCGGHPHQQGADYVHD